MVAEDGIAYFQNAYVVDTRYNFHFTGNTDNNYHWNINFGGSILNLMAFRSWS